MGQAHQRVCVMSGPYPYPPRPYSKGYSREEDEKLAEELFYGTTVRDKTGRDCHRYPSENSPHERQGVEALCRLLLFSDLPSEIIGGLLCSLDSGGSFGRRLVFKPRKKKTASRLSDRSSDSSLRRQPSPHRDEKAHKPGDGQIRHIARNRVQGKETHQARKPMAQILGSPNRS